MRRASGLDSVPPESGIHTASVSSGGAAMNQNTQGVASAGLRHTCCLADWVIICILPCSLIDNSDSTEFPKSRTCESDIVAGEVLRVWG